jgi:hypothetical protein
MRKSMMIFTLATFCFVADTATARDFIVTKLGAHPTPDGLLSTCRKEGGHYSEGGGSYSCTKQCTANAGCSVNCNNDGCTGRTPAPARLVPGGDDLSGILNSSRRPVTR